VGSGTGDHLLERDVVAFRKRGAQAVRPAVRIAVQLPEGSLERSQRSREGAVGAFVRSELDDPLDAELSLDLLGRLSRFVWNDSPERRKEQALRDFAAAGHAEDSSAGR